MNTAHATTPSRTEWLKAQKVQFCTRCHQRLVEGVFYPTIIGDFKGEVGKKTYCPVCWLNR